MDPLPCRRHHMSKTHGLVGRSCLAHTQTRTLLGLKHASKGALLGPHRWPPGAEMRRWLSSSFRQEPQGQSWCSAVGCGVEPRRQPACIKATRADMAASACNRLTLQQTVFGSCSSNWFKCLCEINEAASRARRSWLSRSLCSGEPFRLMCRCWCRGPGGRQGKRGLARPRKRTVTQ